VQAYVIRRLLLLIPTVFLATLIIFLMMRLIPGDIVDLMLGQMDSGSVSFNAEQARAELIHELGMDVPLLTQYGRWLGNILLHGDFGNSLWTGKPVIDEIASAWPITLELSLLSIIVALLIALPIGILSAVRQDTMSDYVARSFATLAIAIPGFWLGTLVIVFPALWWGYMPPIMFISLQENPIGNLSMFILPAIVNGMALSGTTMRMTRTMMLEVLRQDYIRTAWAKGLKESTTVYRHALKNTLIPVITQIGGHLPVLIGGTVIIEQIFCLPGMGRLILEATQIRDYTVVSGTMLLFAVFTVIINLVVDLTYGIFDPRVRYN
jgi:peptide/nickel transport system permease protein